MYGFVMLLICWYYSGVLVCWLVLIYACAIYSIELVLFWFCCIVLLGCFYWVYLGLIRVELDYNVL